MWVAAAHAEHNTAMHVVPSYQVPIQQVCTCLDSQYSTVRQGIFQPFGRAKAAVTNLPVEGEGNSQAACNVIETCLLRRSMH